ncbi:MAG: hypothetical protein ABR517_09165, partial [Thermoanaerobaculia bacterium]
MTNQHLTDEALADLALNPAASDPHLAGCLRCRKSLEEFWTFTALLAEESTWREESPQLPGCENHRLAEIQGVSSRLDDEAVAAQDLKSRLLATVDQAPGILRFAPATVGTLAAALDVAHTLQDSSPSASLQMTYDAESLARRIDWSTYPTVVMAEHRGHIFKERANALRILGRFRDALQAVDQATSEYERSLVSAHPVAVVEYIAASVLSDQGEYAAAMPRLKAAAAVFADFADTTRSLHCRML